MARIFRDSRLLRSNTTPIMSSRNGTTSFLSRGWTHKGLTPGSQRYDAIFGHCAVTSIPLDDDLETDLTIGLNTIGLVCLKHPRVVALV